MTHEIDPSEERKELTEPEERLLPRAAEAATDVRGGENVKHQEPEDKSGHWSV